MEQSELKQIKIEAIKRAVINIKDLEIELEHVCFKDAKDEHLRIYEEIDRQEQILATLLIGVQL